MSDNDHDQQLRDQVTEISTIVREVVQPAIIEIKDAMHNLSVVTRNEYAADRERDGVADKERDERITALESKLATLDSDTKPIIGIHKAISSRISQVLTFIVVGAFLGWLATQVPNYIGMFK